MINVQRGQIVKVLSGREAGKYAVVVDIKSPSFLWLADGDKRHALKPKCKNIKHVQATRMFAKNVLEALEKETLTNAVLRSDLNQYLSRKVCIDDERRCH